MPRSKRPSNVFNCRSCPERDTDEMVQCDSCDCWYHFSCVGVDASVVNREWKCTRCSTTTLGQHRNDTPSAQPLEDASPVPQRVDRINNPQQNVEPSIHQSMSQLNVANVIENRIDDDVMSTASTTTMRKRNLLLQQLEEERLLRERSNQLYLQQKYQILAQSFDEDEEQNNNDKQQHQSLPIESIMHKSSRNDTQINCNQSVRQNQVKFSNSNVGESLSSSQLAARHSMPKDLPKFSGNPEEWPIFISSFEHSTKLAAFSNVENLIRLQKCLCGRALEAVKHRLMLPDMVPDVIRTLRMLFGRPDQIVHILIERAKNITPPKSEKLESLIDYALAIKNVCATIEATNLTAHLNNPVLLKEFVDKLSPNLLLNWALFSRNLESASLLDFSNWLYDIAEAACSVTTLSTTSLSGGRRSLKQSAHVHSHLPANESNVNIQTVVVDKKCVICKNDHLVSCCSTFKNAGLSVRWQMVRQYNLCRTCLEKHAYSRCKVSKACGISGCQAKHHVLLHNYAKQMTNVYPSPTSLMTHQSKRFTKVLFRVLPVTLNANGKSVDTFAFLDGGSSLTLLDEELADALGLSGKNEELCLKWTSNTTRVERNSKIVSLGILGHGAGNQKYYLNNVRTVRSLDLPTQSSSKQILAKHYPHLIDLPLPSYHQAQPRILIGMDNWKLGVPLKVYEGSWSQPIATRTRLGWSVHGPDECSNECVQLERHPFHAHMCECTELNHLVNDFFSLDNIGIRVPTQHVVSAEEKRANKILEDTCIQVGNHFEVGLLWKFDIISLPNSLPMALRRYHQLQKGIEKDKMLRSVLDQQIENLVTKGYAKKLSSNEVNTVHNRIWYLPIFIVRNPNKPSKVRLVWDAAAKCNGVSLNDFLLKGPDLLVPLVTVLYGFRYGKIGICGDIAEMFHQIRVREDDRHAQRFLWNDNQESQEPTVFEMNVMTFGATCSPCIAHYVKNTNAMAFRDSMPRAVEGILEHHYVDDFIDSVNTEAEAIKLAEDVKFNYQRGGFFIRNWVSNSATVLDALNEDSGGSIKAFDMSGETTAEKILGLYWCTSSDAFTYVLKFKRLKRDLFVEGTIPTKREVLKILMSVFDPMGFLSHLLICIKMLLQEIWRTPIGWDEELPANLCEKWFRWTSLLHNVTMIQIPRCYSPLLSEADSEVQLHTFVDASENAYAAVAYFRIEYKMNLDVTIIGAKAKVAPQRPVSIPRLELQAAVLGTRLAAFICKSHKFRISKRIFWTDSKTVLSWLAGDPRKFQQFVMFRVGEVLEASHISEWKWIPTKLNIADKATKWNPDSDYNANSEWFSGPPFLRMSDDKWPRTPHIRDSIEELRPHLLHISQVKTYCVVNETRFNTWRCMYRALAYAILYLDMKLKKPYTPIVRLTSEVIKRSQAALYRQAQFAAYQEEIAILRHNNSQKNKKRLLKSSPLSKLSPYLDENDVLRMNGRILYAAYVDQDCKTPVILPKEHRITFLIVDFYHVKFHHSNHETALNEIKQKYYIANLRSILKAVRRSCQLCKIADARPVVPEMANLPIARMSAFSRPFSFVGLDYFGPITVTVGRRNEKRWGALFTCLTIRAVHIELAHSLSSDSCIMCIRNFVARRGTPLEIYCDNGTNFRGTERELREELAKLDLGKVATYFTTAETSWKFNPPQAPHMGGAWERLVRSVKQVLYRILPTYKVSDETLRSALAEVENTINSRPLTYVSLEADDDEALTPNHFLLGSSNGTKPLCNPTATDLRKNWKRAQILADLFWKKWIKAYLPEINRRGKWFVKVKPIEKGDVVIIVDETLPRNCWPRGRVIDTVVASDGQVRRATVQTSGGVLERPTIKLAVLDIESSGDKESKMELQTASAPLTGGSMLAPPCSYSSKK